MKSGLYVKLDAHYYHDPKILEAGPDAELLYIRALCFAKSILTDGIITHEQLEFLGFSDVQERAETLVQVGLFCRSQHGYQIAAWLKHNRTAKDVERIRRKRQHAGKQRHRQRTQREQSGEQSGEQSAHQKSSKTSSTESESEYREKIEDVGTLSGGPKRTRKVRTKSGPRASLPVGRHGNNVRQQLQALCTQYPQITDILQTRWLPNAVLPASSDTPSAKLSIADTIAKLHTIDGYSWQDVGRIVEYAAIEWAPRYIGSPAKLRKATRAGDRKVHEAIWAQLSSSGLPAGRQGNGTAKDGPPEPRNAKDIP